MINDFENITYELTESELELVPIIIKGVKTKGRKRNGCKRNSNLQKA